MVSMILSSLPYSLGRYFGTDADLLLNVAFYCTAKLISPLTPDFVVCTDGLMADLCTSLLNSPLINLEFCLFRYGMMNLRYHVLLD